MHICILNMLNTELEINKSGRYVANHMDLFFFFFFAFLQLYVYSIYYYCAMWSKYKLNSRNLRLEFYKNDHCITHYKRVKGYWEISNDLVKKELYLYYKNNLEFIIFLYQLATIFRKVKNGTTKKSSFT